MSGSTDNFSFRPLHPGMGQAVAERTILRKKEDDSWETWGDVAHRVALGNSLLAPESERKEEGPADRGGRGYGWQRADNKTLKHARR